MEQFLSPLGGTRSTFLAGRLDDLANGEDGDDVGGEERHVRECDVGGRRAVGMEKNEVVVGFLDRDGRESFLLERLVGSADATFSRKLHDLRAALGVGVHRGVLGGGRLAFANMTSCL